MNRRVHTLVLAAALAVLAAPAGTHAKDAANKKPARANKPAKPAAKRAAPAIDPQKARETFGPFCEKWMEKLAARQRENLARLEWKATGAGFNGTYVGYSTEHGCSVSSDGSVPIGRVLYKEVTYRQEGATLEEARASTPQPVEIYEVTELFQYNKGRWSMD